MKVFCSEYPTEKKAKNVELPLASLKSSYYNRELSDKTEASVIKLSDDEESDATKIDEELSIHEYRDCEMYDISEKDDSAVLDNSALRFSGELVKYYNQFLWTNNNRTSMFFHKITYGENKKLNENLFPQYKNYLS